MPGAYWEAIIHVCVHCTRKEKRTILFGVSHWTRVKSTAHQRSKKFISFNYE